MVKMLYCSYSKIGLLAVLFVLNISVQGITVWSPESPKDTVEDPDFGAKLRQYAQGTLLMTISTNEGKKEILQEHIDNKKLSKRKRAKYERLLAMELEREKDQLMLFPSSFASQFTFSEVNFVYDYQIKGYLETGSFAGFIDPLTGNIKPAEEPLAEPLYFAVLDRSVTGDQPVRTLSIYDENYERLNSDKLSIFRPGVYDDFVIRRKRQVYDDLIREMNRRLHHYAR